MKHATPNIQALIALGFKRIDDPDLEQGYEIELPGEDGYMEVYQDDPDKDNSWCVSANQGTYCKPNLTLEQAIKDARSFL